MSLLLGCAFQLNAQFCAPSVPTFTVNLTGAPDSTWISPPTTRQDTCCGVTNPDRCVQFIVTLDPSANGIMMDIPEGGGCGARPTGSLFYQINCGPPVAIGTPVCLSGPGPHTITFCKPGNNDNCYQITSIPAPDASGDVVATDGCNALMGTVGYVESSIQWRSIPSNPAWEAYLSCTDSCDTVTATAALGAPSFVDYQVCGIPLGDCDTLFVCDTVRVHFVSTLAVTIQPDSPTVCFGTGTTNIQAIITGGAAPFTYQWTTGGLPTGGNTSTIAASPGIFIVQVTDTLNCAIASDTVTVTAFSLPILALAGNDTAICIRDTLYLAGQVQAASGGIWTGGSGTFSPNNTTLDANYFPSPAEQAAGTFQLILTTTGNGTCPPDSDQVTISIVPYPSPLITGPNPVCQFSSATYTTPQVPSNTYLWTATGGTITAGQGTSSVTVLWASPGSATLSLTETNPTGCDTTIILPLTINPKPTPTITGPASLCQFETATYTAPLNPGHSYLWTAIGGTIASGQGTESITVLWGVPGTATLSFTETNTFGCDTTIAVPITIDPKPQTTISGPSQPCAWTVTLYSATFDPTHTYTWTVTGGTINAGQGTPTIDVLWAAAGTGTITLLQTNSFGCDTLLSRTVTILPRPTAQIIGPDSVCAYASATSYTSPLDPVATYLWTVTGGTISTGQGTNTITVDWTSPGLGQIDLTLTHPTGCDTTLALPMWILPNPAPAIAGPLSICAFSPATYTTPNTPTDTYLWTISGGTITVGQGTPSIQVNWAAAGPATLQLQQTTPFGCDTTITLNLQIHPTPQPLIAGPATVCEHTSGHVYSTPAVPGHTYNWSILGGTITAGQSTSSITVTWASQGTGTLSLTQTAPPNAAACDTTIHFPVTIHPKPDPLIIGLDPVCANTTGHIYSVAPAPGNSFLWTVSGGTIVAGQGTHAITVNWFNPGLATITLQQTNTFFCDTTITLPITILPQPLPAITGPASLCAFSTGQTYSTPATANTFLWTVTGGTITAGQGTPTITVAWTTPGAAAVTLTETHPLGCDSTITLPVSILPAPTPTIQGPAFPCAHAPATYTCNPDPSATISWAITGGTILTGQNTPALQVLWNTPGQGSITLTHSYPNGCDSTITLPTTIQTAPIPIVIGPDTICQYSQHTYSTTPLPGVSYTWTPIGGQVISGQGTPAVSVQWDIPGNTYLQLYALASTGCDTLLLLPVHILEGPQAIIDPASHIICEPGNVTFNGTYSIGETAYTWNLGNGGTSTSPSPTSGYWIPGLYTISLIATGPYQCRDTAYATLQVLPGPHAEFTVIPGLEFTADDDTAHFLNHSLQGTAYLWDFGDGSTDTLFEPQHFFAEPGTYTVNLLVTDSLGCTDIYSQTLTVIWDLGLYVPNAFTPNEDGLNDFFNVGHWNLQEFYIAIFSRWGELIYESRDKDFQWPGTYQNAPLPEGAYVWKITATMLGGTPFTKAGSVTLLR